MAADSNTLCFRSCASRAKSCFCRSAIDSIEWCNGSLDSTLRTAVGPECNSNSAVQNKIFCSVEGQEEVAFEPTCLVLPKLVNLDAKLGTTHSKLATPYCQSLRPSLHFALRVNSMEFRVLIRFQSHHLFNQKLF